MMYKSYIGTHDYPTILYVDHVDFVVLLNNGENGETWRW